MKILIGDTGLIGQTLQDSIKFDVSFNSKDITQFPEYAIDGSELYLACLPATKWMVNKDVVGDLNNIYQIYNIIKSYRYTKVVLFSTIDVYSSTPIQADESVHPVIGKLCYGTNRYLFELMIKELDCSNIQIYRLPALFGDKIKKNVLFDLLNGNNIGNINTNSTYQWFNLNKLVQTIDRINLPGTYNLFTEPIHTLELIKLFNFSIKDIIYQDPIIYDYRTVFSDTGYIDDSQTVFQEIKNFVYTFRNKPLSV